MRFCVLKYIGISRAMHGGIAQLARAFGSYPTGRWFKSDFRYQGMRTPAFLSFSARWSSG